MSTTLKPHAPKALAALRIITALLFIAHGTQKLFGFPAAEFQPQAFTLLWFGAVIELVGGTLLLLGLFTRPTAFLLSGEMAVAYFMFHAPNSFFPALNGGDAAILFSFIFLYLLFEGPGALALDNARADKRAAA
ncbi:DoxX family protein [Actibacterium ureilyticum]|uniref:DoxX family protein n=1 Tax=Actibacterium ureilyticum TaxID=1590614 RepID=UPI000BAADF8B|nr:DoxX family protein [Actibacterium ureilyticum]